MPTRSSCSRCSSICCSTPSKPCRPAAACTWPWRGRLRHRAVVRHGSGQLLRIVFRDTGCGIRADVLERLFQPFVTSKERGIGLGLAISRQIMLEHGGPLTACNAPRRRKIRCRSAIGKYGGHRRLRRGGQRPAQVGRGCGELVLKKMKLLIIDDEPNIRFSIEQVFDARSVSGPEAATADEGLQLAAEELARRDPARRPLGTRVGPRRLPRPAARSTPSAW